MLIDLIDDREVDTYIPKCCIVEMAAVSRRLSDKATARAVSRGLLESYEIADESLFFDTAWMVAMDTGCSGFDSYFIALDKVKNASLFTDDNGMQLHGKKADVDVILVRELDSIGIENLFE